MLLEFLGCILVVMTVDVVSSVNSSWFPLTRS